MTPKFSELFYEGIRRASEHHAGSKTYSGRLLRPHAKFVRELIERHSLRSCLDYGAGKGEQYTWVSDGKTADVPAGWTIERYWGMAVDRFDPCWPPYAEMPRAPHGGRWDLVLCTHVLGSVPTVDLRAFLAHVASHANDVLYIAEKVGDVNKAVNPDAENFPRFTRAQWVATIREALPEPNCSVWLSTRERIDGQVITKRACVVSPLPIAPGEGEP